MDDEKIALYVEDYTDVSEKIIDFLSRVVPKLKIEIVKSASEAEKKLREMKYDLLLLDIRLVEPEGDYFKGTFWTRAGQNLLKLIRNGEYEPKGTSRSVPVIVISAVSNQESVEEIKNIGQKDGNFLEYYNKPVSLNEIFNSVNKALSISK